MSVALLEKLLISALFGLAGLTKLLAVSAEVEAFARWDFPAGFMYFIGLLEVAAALGIWLRRLSAFVALCLAGLTLGALGTRLVFAEWGMALLTGLVLALLLHYLWRERAELFPAESPFEPPARGPGSRPMP